MERLREVYEFEYRKLTQELGRRPTEAETRKIRASRYRQAEEHLDLGYGECLLRDHRIAQIATEAVRWFDGDRYHLHAWCVMPNHVHVLLTLAGERLPTEVAGSWKKFSSRRINVLAQRSGQFWQEEGFDHLVRGPHSFNRIAQYIWDNPAKANLGDWPWVGGDGSLPETWET